MYADVYAQFDDSLLFVRPAWAACVLRVQVCCRGIQRRLAVGYGAVGVHGPYNRTGSLPTDGVVRTHESDIDDSSTSGRRRGVLFFFLFFLKCFGCYPEEDTDGMRRPSFKGDESY